MARRCDVPVAERSARRRSEWVARETGHHLFRPLRAGGDSAMPLPTSTFGLNLIDSGGMEISLISSHPV